MLLLVETYSTLGLDNQNHKMFSASLKSQTLREHLNLQWEVTLPVGSHTAKTKILNLPPRPPEICQWGDSLNFKHCVPSG